MTVFEALSLMIAFATLVVLILTYRKQLRHEKNRLAVRRFLSEYKSLRRTGFPQPVVSLCLLYVLSCFLSNLKGLRWLFIGFHCGLMTTLIPKITLLLFFLKLKNIFHRFAKHLGDIHCQLKRGIVFSVFQVADGFCYDTDFTILTTVKTFQNKKFMHLSAENIKKVNFLHFKA